MKNLYRILGLSCALGFLHLTSANAGPGICHITCTDDIPVEIAEPGKQACCDEFNARCNGYGTATFDGGGFPICPTSVPPQF